MTPHNAEFSSRQQQERLESWKAIAAYLKRDVRTVQRWEQVDGLPVRRSPEGRIGRVFAYPSDLDAWRQQARTSVEPTTQITARSTWRVVTLIGATAAGIVGMIITIWIAGVGETRSSHTVSRVWGGPEVDRLGAISSDGRYASYVDIETDNLAIRDLKTGSSRRVTRTGASTAARGIAHSSVFSRDSTQIAYAWRATDGTVELRIMPLDGSASRVIVRNPNWTSVRPVGWTSMAREIVCVFESTAGTQIAFVTVETGRVRVIKSLAAGSLQGVSLSPDDHVVVYDAPVDPSNPARDIFAVASDGTREVRIAGHAANDLTPSWAPDGSTVVFVSDRGGPPAVWAVHLVDMRASDPWLVKAGVPVTAILGFTPDGALYYRTQTSRTDVYSATLDRDSGAATAVVLRGNFDGRNIASDWSPDGRALVYLSQRSADDFKRVLTIRTLATGEEREFPLSARNAWSPRWSPEGRSILFAAEAKAPVAALYVLDVATGSETRILEREQPVGAFGPAWMPDGRSVVFTVAEQEQRAIVRLDLASRKTEVIYRVEGTEFIGDASVSPDGRAIAFRTTSGAGPTSTSLKVVPASGGDVSEVIRFTMPETAAGPVWTGDGRLLFVKSHLQTPDRRELWSIDVTSRELRSTGISAENLRYVRVHPDGRQIAFSAGGPQAELWAIQNLRFPDR